MWKEIVNSDYFLEFTHDISFEICVTDYVSAWTTYFSKKAFIDQLKESNEGLELSNDNDYIQKGVYMLSNLNQLKSISIRKEDNGNSLSISMKIIMGYPFCFECKLSKCSEEIYFEKITNPLLKTISDLRASQTELRRLLIKKDKEIEEYKCEGGEIVLRHLKTVAFNDEEHMKKFKTYEEIFGSNSIPTSIVEKSVKLLTNNVKPEQTTAPIKEEPNNTTLNITKQERTNMKQETEIKQEPINIKQEQHTPVFEDSPSLIALPGSCKQEVIKTERPTRNNERRKRLKLNY